MPSDAHVRFGQSLHSLGFVYTCNGERDVRAELLLNLWKDLFEKPDHRIPVGTGFFMDCSNEQEPAALIKGSRSWLGFKGVADDLHIFNSLCAKLSGIRLADSHDAIRYRGKVHLSSSDAKGGTQDYTFSASDKGVHVFSYTFNALGFQTLTVTDTTNSSITGKSTVNVVAKA